MNNANKSIVNKLKMLIDKNGPDYLSNEPYLTYRELTVSTAIDEKLAGAILLALVRGICQDVRSYDNQEMLSELIQKECCFNKKMSDGLAEIFFDLYSKDNEDVWETMKLSGWKQFLKSDFCCKWNGFSVWNTEGGSVDCHFEADIILKPVETTGMDEELSCALSENPFMTQDAITECYKKRISRYLDYEFEEYCSCDDYYQPVVEDFEIDSYVKQWCKENEFELVSCEGDGHDDGYEPSFRHAIF
ncbi:MAG TPA: hypothetical protein DDY59_15020 [Lachnospiraceae bacterium]|jgi:hypothetical protein|uniref:Uncharacterized protein n=1 Tax=Muricomes intestini TaxID=1796634 RepID=A0A4R3KGR1_9FIRM|nr:hypothetical protein [Muricomes intestini]TCS82303.1 hypothetical protein EDD59_102171 [Muricomes intestini]HAX53749.1 hypothetical protein [Lachnospiraceae bacterium]HBI74472.1 hypothetical protein [Lachnospiraceae bacterium]HCR84684.1 hypothetical protein [Lachnospiraceae bacterium]